LLFVFRVICLCAQFEAVFQHGLRKSRGLALTAAAIKHAAGFSSKTEAGTLFSVIQLLTSHIHQCMIVHGAKKYFSKPLLGELCALLNEFVLVGTPERHCLRDFPSNKEHMRRYGLSIEETDAYECSYRKTRCRYCL